MFNAGQSRLNLPR